jgi:hypothetical protein
MTDDPLLSRVLGFSEAEIRDAFPTELARLGDSLASDAEGAVAELTRWYNGYSFDGSTSCFNPYPVLVALLEGTITERELDGASGTDWLSLTPGDVTVSLAQELAGGLLADVARVDIADLKARSVRAVPLLLQTGLLSLVVGKPAQCRAPNEYARRSLQHMVSNALVQGPAALAPLAVALRARDRAAFSTATTLLFEQIPRTLFKTSKGDVRPREAVYHAALFSALKATAPPNVDVQIQVSSARGLADIVITFSDAPHAAAWVIEVGLGSKAAAKLPQAQQYAQALGVSDVSCCAIVVDADSKSASVAAGGAIGAYAWSQRVHGAWTLV